MGETQIVIELSLRLKKARVAAGLTQAEAARLVGIPRTALVQVEGGSAGRNVSVVELLRLCRIYRCEVSGILNMDIGFDPEVDTMRERVAMKNRIVELESRLRRICKLSQGAEATDVPAPSG